MLKRSQLRPLATGVHRDRHMIQLCYTAEVVESAMKLLEESGVPGLLQLREGLALVALVGAGVCKIPAQPPFLSAVKRSAN